ncbi:aldolase/citrate lyase family protein [Mesorhizobium sp. LMG 17147]|uniref:HpcH/HpaI aldolase family protein n=1 Tax=Mesorhizobium sp. LMG 17147 TaxID=2963091 RepID=UPI0020C9E1BC|nr:aldolase/citrate lyase family protein [Mesorhizobium sp. LMG 17147]MCP9233363.1 aldolase/citrate lyase family protein [Mesorhizobium sp. LMG 17147]
MSTALGFRGRLLSGQPLVGTWIKTPSRIVAEVLAGAALDVLCLDAEHAPFDRKDLDGAIFASSAQDMPVLVRPASASPENILNALDLGATGVVAPHIRSGSDAEALVRHCLFGPGGRGYAGSTRAAGFTRSPMAAYRQRAIDDTAIIAQLEDREALNDLADIVRIDRLDCVFVGRIDLTISMGAQSPDDPAVIEAVTEICRRAREAGRRVGMFVSNLADVPVWIERGASFFLLSSDQTFLMQGAQALRTSFEAAAQGWSNADRGAS